MTVVGKIRSENVTAFLAANAESPVVMGYVPGAEGGGVYKLKDGREFRLTVAECRSMDMPRWDLPPVSADDDPHSACRWCGEEHPTGVLDDDLCPGCVDVADDGED